MSASGKVSSREFFQQFAPLEFACATAKLSRGSRERYSSLDVLGCSGETGGGVLKLFGFIEVGTRG
jgi:hypothetical protein